jgi:hypothetical protein
VKVSRRCSFETLSAGVRRVGATQFLHPKPRGTHARRVALDGESRRRGIPLNGTTKVGRARHSVRAAEGRHAYRPSKAHLHSQPSTHSADRAERRSLPVGRPSRRHGESSGLPENCSQGLLAGSVYQGNDMTMKNNFPKILAAVLAGCFAASVHAQLPADGRPNDARIIIDPATGQPRATGSQETRFDLNFNGGTPKQFIEAIKAQSGLKVNVIIPSEEAEAQLPAIEVSGVTVPRLFQALTAASTKITNVVTGAYYSTTPGARPQAQYTTRQLSQGLRTSDNPPTQDSIWYFYVERPMNPPVIQEDARVSVEVFQLAPLLKSHSVDEITTAVKTTWQMMDEAVTPELKYHSDTGLLIAKGTEMQLQMVQQVLVQLQHSEKGPTGGSAGVPAPGRPVPSQP